MNWINPIAVNHTITRGLKSVLKYVFHSLNCYEVEQILSSLSNEVKQLSKLFAKFKPMNLLNLYRLQGYNKREISDMDL